MIDDETLLLVLIFKHFVLIKGFAHLECINLRVVNFSGQDVYKLLMMFLRWKCPRVSADCGS